MAWLFPQASSSAKCRVFSTRHDPISRAPAQKRLGFNPSGSGHLRAFSIASELSTEVSDMPNIVWKCEQAWAGKLYNRMVFNSRKEAENFVSTVQETEPDQIFSIEAIQAEQLWN
jgi:hypothetical protein